MSQPGPGASLDAVLRDCGDRIGIGRQCGRAEAVFEARLLAGYVTGLDTGGLMLEGDRSLAPALADRLLRLCDRRAAGEPVAYLTGKRGFWRHRFRTTPGALIPRPDTELLVEWALERIPPNASPRVLDLGTGTGAIGLSIAAERPDAVVDAVDRSMAAVRMAAANRSFLAEQGAPVRLGLWRGDWLAAVAPASLDLIVSNPPYIPADDPHLGQGDLRHEPTEALVADEAGLGDYRRIVGQAVAALRPGGWLLFEHGYDQADAVAALLRAAGFEEIETRRDVAGQPRATAGRRGASQASVAGWRRLGSPRQLR